MLKINVRLPSIKLAWLPVFISLPIHCKLEAQTFMAKMHIIMDGHCFNSARLRISRFARSQVVAAIFFCLFLIQLSHLI